MGSVVVVLVFVVGSEVVDTVENLVVVVNRPRKVVDELVVEVVVLAPVKVVLTSSEKSLSLPWSSTAVTAK